MIDVTVIWADEDEGMVPHVFHGSTEGRLEDHRTRMVLLHQAMASEMDTELFELSAEQMTSHMIAVFEGHITPRYLWDGDDIS